MRNVEYHSAIHVDIPWGRIYDRLGYREGATSLREEEKGFLIKVVQEAFDLVSLRGASMVLAIEQCSSEGVRLEGGTFFRSASLAGMLEGCWGVLLMAATAGGAIMEAIERSSSGDLTRAVVMDAVGSETVDSALDWIMKAQGRALLRHSMRITRRRFSSGYGDLSLETQKTIYELLDLGKIGIRITDAMILVPEKSVTAVAGVVLLK